jgi:hypothetical protein
MTDKPQSRSVNPRKWALIAATGLAAAQPALHLPELFIARAHAASSEAGEAGEGAVEVSEGASGFLTRLGYFEGTYRIVASLYLSGARDLAREHQEASHHAFYEDIEPGLAQYNAPGFTEEAEAFAKAIENDASDDEVEGALTALLQALDRASAATGASLYERLMSMHDLTALAEAEYEGGVENGQVELAMEFRDSWGFFETTRQRALMMQTAEDPIEAEAGRDVLAQLEGAAAVYPSLTAETASDDSSALAVAAGWIEIIALRRK